MYLVLDKLTGDEIPLELKLESSEKRIRASRSQIERVMVNLLVNARDAMNNKGKAEIRTSDVTFQGKCCVLLEVEDHGSGIPDDVLDKIFDPFFTTKEKGKGTGLGLSTVFGIVKDNKGEIEVNSRSGVGTVFKIYFPCVDGRQK